MWSKIKKSDDGEFIITKCELELLLEQASKEGAKKALTELGLHDENAPTDIRDLRELLKAFRIAKKDAFQDFCQVDCGRNYDSDYSRIYFAFR